MLVSPHACTSPSVITSSTYSNTVSLNDTSDKKRKQESEFYSDQLLLVHALWHRHQLAVP